MRLVEQLNLTFENRLRRNRYSNLKYAPLASLQLAREAGVIYEPRPSVNSYPR